MVRDKTRHDYWRFKKGILYMFVPDRATAYPLHDSYEVEKSGAARGATFKVSFSFVVFFIS